MKKLTKKSIKALKREVKEYGARTAGYYYSIEEALTFDDFNKFLEYTTERGMVDLIPSDYYDRLNMMITVLAEVLNYQEFKRLVPYFMGY